MALARFAIIMELREDGRVYLDATNKDLPKDTIIMQLKGLTQQLENEYFDDAAQNRTILGPS